ncbi:Peptidase S54, rhomboid domain [Phytophthora cactorum]|nr:Peptidase S54, rhomboid domain [Phytophthora cactorum]
MLRTALLGSGFPLRPATARGITSTKFGTRLSNALQPTARSPLLHKRPTAAEQQLRHQYHYRSSSRRESRAVSGDVVVLGLISVNVAVTIGWMRAQAPPPKHRAQQLRSFQPSMRTMLTHFTTSTQHLQEGRYYTLLTSMQICDLLGHRKFLGLYLASGVISSAAAVYEQRLSGRLTFNLGASGAVNAITAMSFSVSDGTLLILHHSHASLVGGSLFIFKDAYSFATDRRRHRPCGTPRRAAIGGAYYYPASRRFSEASDAFEAGATAVDM